jgi:hypothetical protein
LRVGELEEVFVNALYELQVLGKKIGRPELRNNWSPAEAIIHGVRFGRLPARRVR